jgi:hypothetical protein
MRGIERVADDAALGVAAIGLHSAHQQADELDAVTISGSRTAPSGASIPKHYPGMVPLGYDASGAHAVAAPSHSPRPAKKQDTTRSAAQYSLIRGNDRRSLLISIFETILELITP